MGKLGSSNVHGYSVEKLAHLAELSRASKARRKGQTAVPTAVKTELAAFLAEQTKVFYAAHPELALPVAYRGMTKTDALAKINAERTELDRIAAIVEKLP